MPLSPAEVRRQQAQGPALTFPELLAALDAAMLRDFDGRRFVTARGDVAEDRWQSALTLYRIRGWDVRSHGDLWEFTPAATAKETPTGAPS